MTLSEQQNVNFIMQNDPGDPREKMAIGLSRRRASALEIQELFSALQQLVPRNSRVRSPSEVSNGKAKRLSTDSSSGDGSEDNVFIKHSPSKVSLHEKLSLLVESSTANSVIDEQLINDENTGSSKHPQKEYNAGENDIDKDWDSSFSVSQEESGQREYRKSKQVPNTSQIVNEDENNSFLKTSSIQGAAREDPEIRTEGRISSLSNLKKDTHSLLPMDLCPGSGHHNGSLAPPAGHSRLVSRRATFAIGSSSNIDLKNAEKEEHISGKVKDLLILPKGASTIKRSLSKTLADFGTASSNKLSKINVFKKRKPTNKQVKEKSMNVTKGSPEKSDSSSSTKRGSITSLSSIGNKQHVKQKTERQGKRATHTSHYLELEDLMEHKPLHNETIIHKPDLLYSPVPNNEDFKDQVNQRLQMWVEKATALSNRDSDSDFDQDSLPDDMSCCSKEDFRTVSSYQPKGLENKAVKETLNDKEEMNESEEPLNGVSNDINKDITKKCINNNRVEGPHKCNCPYCPILRRNVSEVNEIKPLFTEVGTMTEKGMSADKDQEVRFLKYVGTEHKQPLKNFKPAEASLFYGFTDEEEPVTGDTHKVTLVYVDDPRCTKLYNESFKKRSSPLPYSVNTAQFFTNQIKSTNTFKKSRKISAMRTKDRRYTSLPCLLPFQNNQASFTQNNPSSARINKSLEEADKLENKSLNLHKANLERDKKELLKNVDTDTHTVIVGQGNKEENSAKPTQMKDSSGGVSITTNTSVSEHVSSTSVHKSTETFL